MSHSLSEIDALCRKAARGAGYSWGLAEEAGRAVRWLEARSLPGVAALAALLQAQDGQDYESLRPRDLDTVWQASGGALCPLIAGVTLADHAPFAAAPTLEAVQEPLLLLPFLAASGLCSDAIPSLDDTGWTVKAREGMVLTAGAMPLPDPSPANITVDPNAWAALNRFAHRTYVPATAASRAGAGAGETDND